jgi:hypothetical protein
MRRSTQTYKLKTKALKDLFELAEQLRISDEVLAKMMGVKPRSIVDYRAEVHLPQMSLASMLGLVHSLRSKTEKTGDEAGIDQSPSAPKLQRATDLEALLDLILEHIPTAKILEEAQKRFAEKL